MGAWRWGVRMLLVVLGETRWWEDCLLWRKQPSRSTEGSSGKDNHVPSTSHPQHPCSLPNSSVLLHNQGDLHRFAQCWPSNGRRLRRRRRMFRGLQARTDIGMKLHGQIRRHLAPQAGADGVKPDANEAAKDLGARPVDDKECGEQKPVCQLGERNYYEWLEFWVSLAEVWRCS